MKKKRFLKDAIIVILVIVVAIAGIKLSAEFIYDNHLKQDDEALLESYETKQEKCELIKSIPNDFIEEGKGINLQEIPDNIRYEIRNQSDGNIQFYYYIEPESSTDSNPYKAWITLSKDYNVIDEKYGIELEDFETYKNNQKGADMLLAGLYAAMSIAFIAFAALASIGIGWFIYYLVKFLKNKKSQS